MCGMFVWICMLAVTASAKKGSADPPPPPTISVPQDPGAAATPYASEMPIPPITGRGTELQLESLSRVQRSFNIQVPLEPANVPASVAGAVLRHVAADARWRLIQRDGALVAYRRESRGREHHLDWSGYIRRPKEVWTTAIRFDEWSQEGAWATSPHVVVTPATASSLSVNTFFLDTDDMYGWETTAITIEGEGLFVDIYESGKRGGRDRTATALGEVLGYLGGLGQDPQRIDTDGYHRWFMPRREPSKDGDSIELSTQGRGTLTVQAHVNPGRPGWTWVRILDDQLRPWEETALATGTRERIGYSGKAGESFFLGVTIPVPSSPKFSGTAEVWFMADGAEAPERLTALPVVVPKR